MLNMAAVVGIFQQFVTNLGFFLVHSTSAPVCSLPTSPPPQKKNFLDLFTAFDTLQLGLELL